MQTVHCTFFLSKDTFMLRVNYYKSSNKASIFSVGHFMTLPVATQRCQIAGDRRDTKNLELEIT
jgi:hypothetical protein